MSTSESDGTAKMDNSDSDINSCSKNSFQFHDIDDSDFSNCSATTEEDYLSTESWRKGDLVWARPIRYPTLPWWPAVIIERPNSSVSDRLTVKQVLSVSESSSDMENSDNSEASSGLQLIHLKLLRKVPVFKVYLLGSFKSGGSRLIDHRILSALQTRIRPYRGLDELCEFMRDTVNQTRRKLKALTPFAVPSYLQPWRKIACMLADRISLLTKDNLSSTFDHLPWLDITELDYASDHFMKLPTNKTRKLKKSRKTQSSDERSSSGEETSPGIVSGKVDKSKKYTKKMILRKYRDLQYAFEHLTLGKTTVSSKEQRMRFCFKCNILGDVYVPPKSKKDSVLSSNISDHKIDSSLLFPCPGGCSNFGHLSCLGGTMDKLGRCSLCTKGLKECFLCKNTDNDSNGNILRCLTSFCRRWYHLSCLKTTPPFCSLLKDARAGTFVCPEHFCMTCQASNPGAPLQPVKPCLRCIHCPSMFHYGDDCIPSGSTILGKSWIICPRHSLYSLANEAQLKDEFEELRTLGLTMHKATNVSWCFICSSGGRIICCENCPSSFHEECVKIENIPDNFVCEDCTAGKLPHFGEIVWVRLPPTLASYVQSTALSNDMLELLKGHPLRDLFMSEGVELLTTGIRWWPAEVLHPKFYEADLYDEMEDRYTVRKTKETIRAFLKCFVRVRLFNLKQDGDESACHLWTTNSRIFSFEEGDDERLENSTDSIKHHKGKEHGPVIQSEANDTSSDEEDDPLLLPGARKDATKGNPSLVPFICNFTPSARKRGPRQTSGGALNSSIPKEDTTNDEITASIKRIKLPLTIAQKSLQKSTYDTAVRMAAQGWRLRKQKREKCNQDSSKGPRYFKKIKINYPIGNVRVYKLQDVNEALMCECKPGDPDPCGPTSECLNRELKFECVASLCRNGAQCRNQRFTKRQYPPQKPFKTQDGRGWGLRALTDIDKGEFVNEYIGDLIDEEEANRRLKHAHENNITEYYMMKLDNQRIIDAGPKGNLSRFANHSCDPNLNTEKWTVNGDVRVGLFAVKHIKAGEELTFNYNFMSLGQEMLNCKCGTSSCVGHMGAGGGAKAGGNESTEEASDSTDSCSSEPATRNKLRKRRAPSTEPDSEPEFNPFPSCYRCERLFSPDDNAQTCSRSDCRRRYHLSCLDLDKPCAGGESFLYWIPS
ncbi:Histone-lysine N-methyltransferase NSD3 [Cichlidogyrus casuarinus]|uniref:Histone-lysine N-methyltransferase NSD3 n=1 Tax=Cichlidogyrus casuarinus TaxID=1844966 RepID=A0ABD2QBA0_9PLAT